MDFFISHNLFDAFGFTELLVEDGFSWATIRKYNGRQFTASEVFGFAALQGIQITLTKENGDVEAKSFPTGTFASGFEGTSAPPTQLVGPIFKDVFANGNSQLGHGWMWAQGNSEKGTIRGGKGSNPSHGWKWYARVGDSPNPLVWWSDGWSAVEIAIFASIVGVCFLVAACNVIERYVCSTEDCADCCDGCGNGFNNNGGKAFVVFIGLSALLSFPFALGIILQPESTLYHPVYYVAIAMVICMNYLIYVSGEYDNCL